ncbi:MAG: hypothetical protein JWN88_188 [Frankiales bacterium]|nr:hypothetical protein [Frankiales bacterium]
MLALAPAARSVRSLAVLLGVLGALLVPGTAASAAGEDSDVVSRVNAARAAAGLGLYRSAPDLAAVARGQAERMGRENRLYHNANLGNEVVNWSSVGENVGYGASVANIHTALMGSPGHRANILSPTFTEVGVGTSWAGGRLWVAQVFRTPIVPAGFSVSPALASTVAANAALLGTPTSPEYPAGAGLAQDFLGGDVLWSTGTGGNVVQGAIRVHYRELRGAGSVLGLPVTSERATPHKPGRYNHFQGGSVYWSPGTPAREVHGSIRETWSRLGWENSPLGFPITDEVATPWVFGRFNHFEGGSIYWTPATGAHEVRGAIRGKWSGLGWENGLLGFPVTDELGTPDGSGRFNHFQGGSIYWTPATGAHEVHGAIRQRWAGLGWERGALGYPTSDEYSVPGGRRSDFQKGSITWDASSGVTTVR